MTGTILLSALFALLGIATGGVINLLADDLPRRQRPSLPRCFHCDQPLAPRYWLALLRLPAGGCPHCRRPVRRRAWLVEAGTAVLFAALPFLIANPLVLVINTFHIAVLILIIVIDLENRLILDVVTYPATAIALLGSLLVPPEENTIWLALVGAAVSFVLFYLIYWFGQLLFGPGAFGFGDVKLALLLGAMLGFHRVFFALGLGVLGGGVISALLLLSRRFSRDNYLPYGQYLATAGIIMLIWGAQLAANYIVD